jgi:hypothetical protein
VRCGIFCFDRLLAIHGLYSISQTNHFLQLYWQQALQQVQRLPASERQVLLPQTVTRTATCVILVFQEANRLAKLTFLSRGQ